jgi:hypothetical protein
MKKTVLLFSLLLITLCLVHAQKVVIKSGSFDFLRNQKVILVQFDYSNLGVGKFDKEDDYIAKKVADYNKSEAGKGDNWKKAWFDDRPNRYEPKFELLFNEYMADREIRCDKTTKDASYIMVVHTTFIEPGFNVGVSRKPAYINAEIKFVDAVNKKEVAAVSVENCPGRDAFGYDYDTGLRIQEAYAKLGKSLASLINKKFQ